MGFDPINFAVLSGIDFATTNTTFDDEYTDFIEFFDFSQFSISPFLDQGLFAQGFFNFPVSTSSDNASDVSVPDFKSSRLSDSLYNLQTIGAEFAVANTAAARNSLIEEARNTTTNGTFLGEYIVIDAFAIDGDGAALLDDLTSLGLINGASFAGVASGLLPLSAISELEGLDNLLSARETFAIFNSGSVTTQADASIQADIARAQFGVDGSGLSIGVLSDSFNNLGGFAADVASGDLPSFVNVLEDLPIDPDDPGSDEGRAILQIIHDIAPGSDLLFHTAFLGIASFAQGIIDLANAGADIIIDDVIFFAEPFFQDGIIAQAVDQVTAQGVLFFSSAGNSGTDSYRSFFRNSGIVEPGTSFGAANVFAHDFDPGAGVDTRQLLSLGDEEELSISFQFDESSFSSSGVGPTSDYDIFLFEAGTNNIVASSVSSNNSEPVEILTFTNETGSTQQYELVITRFSGSRDNLLQYIDFSGDANFLEFTTNSPTLVGHANAAGAVAVGASAFFNNPEFGVNPPVLNGFSSVGGVDILFDTNGNRLAVPEQRGGPLFTAPDGGNTTFFGNDIGFDSDSFPNFFGTSASAPAAAAAAALLLDAVPNATNEQVLQALVDTAIDIGAPGIDLASGAGLIQVDDAIANLVSVAGNTPPPASATPGNDTLEGTPSADSIDGLAGNDQITGLGGNDSLIGGDGADTLLGGAGDDILNGNNGADSLVGGDNNDSLTGDAGFDTLIGGGGADTLLGGSGADSLSGDGGDDFLDGGSNLDTITGAEGDDTIIGGSGADIVSGGIGNDDITTGGGFDTVFGGDGFDTIDTSVGADSIEGGDGDDLINSGTNLDIIIGGAGNDTITALSGADLIDGGIGNDFIAAGAGFDTLIGGEGNDTILGSVGGDSITGGNGNDSLNGESNLDTIFGGDGDDTIIGGSASDQLDGGNDNDLIEAGAGFDTVTGGAGNDTITGGIGADSLDGGEGDDIIRSDSNIDTLIGGLGNDTLTGGSAGDLFVFADNFGNDVITDFNPTANTPERIDLSALTAITDFVDLVDNHLSTDPVTGDAVITDGTNTITLEGVSTGQLLADNFLF